MFEVYIFAPGLLRLPSFLNIALKVGHLHFRLQDGAMVCRLVILEWILLLNRHSVNGRRLVASCVVRQAFRIEDDLRLLFFLRVRLTGPLLPWPTNVRQYIGVAGHRRRLNLRHG